MARRWLLGLLIAGLVTGACGCVVRISFFTIPDPNKYCISHNIVEQVTGCKVEWVEVSLRPFRLTRSLVDAHASQIASGMQGVEKLADGSLDIGVLGSVPTTCALSSSQPFEVISVQSEFWEAEAMIVRSEIHSPDVRSPRTCVYLHRCCAQMRVQIYAYAYEYCMPYAHEHTHVSAQCVYIVYTYLHNAYTCPCSLLSSMHVQEAAYKILWAGDASVP